MKYPLPRLFSLADFLLSAAFLLGVVFLPGVVFLLGGCGFCLRKNHTAGGMPAAAHFLPCDENETICKEDSRMLGSLTRGLEKLLKEGKAPKMKALVGQLGRKRHPLSLPAAPEKTLSPVTLYRQCKKSVLVLGSLYKCSKCTRSHASVSTGFAITESGVIATAYHVVNKPDHAILGAMTEEGRIYPVAQVLAASKSDDIAILKLDGSGFSPLSLSPDNPVGTPVTVISHPAKRFYTFAEGIISRYSMAKRYGSKVPVMAITSDFARGSSGGPVFNDRGGVVGMVARTYSIYTRKKGQKKRNLQMVVKYCVPAKSILNLLTK
jgi:S1-C subfamily serine protease